MQIATLSPCFSFLRPILPATILMLGLGLAQPAQAATLFVAPAPLGNNLVGISPNNCQASSKPCKTVTYALTLAQAGDTISVAAGTYNFANGETFPLTIKYSLTLTGAGAGSTFLDAMGRKQRVITISSGTFVTISGVTIMRGDVDNGSTDPSDYGGGILNDGLLLTLIDSIVSGNKASSGGGILNYGGSTLILNNSTVSYNTAAGAGGIYNFGGKLTLINSTVSNNIARRAGGIWHGGTMTLINSTVSYNTVTGDGGGIFNICTGTTSSTATLINSTVSGNKAGTVGGGIVNFKDPSCSATITFSNSTVTGNSATRDGGGIFNSGFNSGGTVKLKNTIVAGNTGNPGPNCNGTITSLGHNLSSDATCLGGTGDLNSPTPLLGPLANNGGPTQTHAPLPGSAAIDGVVPLADCTDANNTIIATDQRGVARPKGAACDIGSVEFQMFEYAVKFVCGRQAGPFGRSNPPFVAPGFYLTDINVHNPNGGPINFVKKFARALGNQKAGAVSRFFPATLKADEAFAVECLEIMSNFQSPLLSFVTGFVVFQSPQELDIVTVYSAAAVPNGQVVTMHMERVPPRR
ncbi:MAG TPA: choice-of-anchor Q domain-containing protein [Xanthobacteraceae bacterium]|nr:choice-of-anchor Q domain-containing protein [Xanthobacteraceae bacterium]